MRKNIALILALVMILSLVPLTAFAASNNSIDRVPTVADDETFTVGDLPNVPSLQIEARGLTVFATEVFRLNLTNAEFLYDEYAIAASGDDEAEYEGPVTWDNPAGDGTITIARRTATSATITVEGDDEDYSIFLFTEIQGEGEARVTVDALSSQVSSGTLTFAVGASGDTIATVASVETIRRGIDQEAGTILIDETTPGAISGLQEFRLRLPSNFSWSTRTEIDFTEWGLGILTPADPQVTIGGSNNRDLTVIVTAPASDVRSTIFVYPYINVSRSASFGDVAVSLTGVRGDVSSASNLIIADYVDFGIDVDVQGDGELEFFTGRFDDDYSVEITLDETLAGSFLPGRVIDFELPGWVWVYDVIVSDGDGELELDEEGNNEFFYDVDEDDEEVTFEIFFTIEGNAAVDGPRDIPLTITGAGIPETTVTMGVAKPAVMVEVGEQVSTIEAGLQRQAAPEITITETEAGAIMDGNLVVFMRDFFADSMRVDSFDWEIVEGDIEIDDDSTAGGNLTLEIGAESEEASTIRLYNIRVTLDRTVPMGPFRADIGGSALVENTTALLEDEGIETGFVGRVERFEYVQVGTPIAPIVPVTPQVVFTVGQMAYMVNGEMRMMDVAPFISEGRIMVPVRYMEELFGMQPIWNPTARTVTIMYNNQVFEMAIGSTMLRVNGAPFMEMETAAMIVDSRTFVPLSRFARAMNIPYVWDAATQTVTFN